MTRSADDTSDREVIATTGISMLMIFTVELIFPRRLKFRTNTA